MCYTIYRKLRKEIVKMERYDEYKMLLETDAIEFMSYKEYRDMIEERLYEEVSKGRPRKIRTQEEK